MQGFLLSDHYAWCNYRLPHLYRWPESPDGLDPHLLTTDLTKMLPTHTKVKIINRNKKL